MEIERMRKTKEGKEIKKKFLKIRKMKKIRKKIFK